jgi:hypothetical protein
MLKLLQTFLDIALWRKGPQDLPASRFLLLCALATYVSTNFVQVRLFDLRLRTAALLIAVDVAMLLGWLWVVLAFFGRRQRFVQTITAVLGVGTLLVCVDIAVRAAQLAIEPADSLPPSWLLLRFLAIALIMGRIFMHALDKGLITGMALTVAIVYSTDAVAHLMITQLQGL